MTFIKRIAILFYVTFILFFASFLILFSIQYWPMESINQLFSLIYVDDSLRLTTGILAGILLLLNFMIYMFFSVNVHRDKVIAFDNPSGRVSVSLLALEELSKRAISRMAEIKDVRAKIVASKKGLQVKIKLILGSEVNIPDISAKLQALVTKKIQSMIGVDESINVSIFVGKILSERLKEKKVKDNDAAVKEDSTEPNIPFHGYRA